MVQWYAIRWADFAGVVAFICALRPIAGAGLKLKRVEGIVPYLI